MIYVLTWQGDDPFVSGGVPIYASTSEQDAWDTAAACLAEGVDEVWRGRLRYLRGSRTEAQVAAGIAHGYQVFPLRLAAADQPSRPSGDADRLAGATEATPPTDSIEYDVAVRIARSRFGPGVSMDGSHNPRPSEWRMAREIVADVRASTEATELRAALEKIASWPDSGGIRAYARAALTGATPSEPQEPTHD